MTRKRPSEKVSKGGPSNGTDGVYRSLSGKVKWNTVGGDRVGWTGETRVETPDGP